jgi:hypothetical protein
MNNEEHKCLSRFRPLLRGNSPTSSGLILMETSVTKGEQSTQLVHVLKGDWISCPLPEGKRSFYMWSWGPLIMV